MMNNLTKTLTFSMPLTYSLLEQGKKLSATQINPTKQRQIFLNYLAVQVVHYYCQCLGIETQCFNLDDSWELLNQSVLDQAELSFPTGDKLECRPILPHQTEISLPLEVQTNRVGYLLIEIDEQQRKGTILGFMFSDEVQTLHRSKMQSLDCFLEYCQRFILNPIDYLTQLFQLTPEWLNPEEVLVPDYRRLKHLSGDSIGLKQEKGRKIEKAQIIAINKRRLALIVHLIWESIHQIHLKARIQPIDSQKSLPLNLQIALIDSENRVLTQKIADEGDNCLRLVHDLPQNHQLNIQIQSGEEQKTQKIGF